ncbi:hypothetical protein [Spirosoma koreense]
MFPWIYYTISVGLLIVLILQCQSVRPTVDTKNWFRSDAFFVGLALVALTFMRLPSLLDNSELNPDEGQLVTQAITLTRDPVFGRSIDGTSIGPINSYLLLIPHLFGFPIDYTDAHLTSLLLIALALLIFYAGLKQLFSPFVSRATLLILVVFFAWTTENDYLHYSSELSSLPIITTCFYLAIRIIQSAPLRVPALWYLSLGFLAGLIPYCKLQTLPVVGSIMAVVTLYLFKTYGQRAIRPVGLMTMSFLVPTLLVFGLAYGFGVERYFIDYYFIGNLTTYSQLYADSPLVHRNFLKKLIGFPIFSIHHPDFALFILFNGLALVLASLFTRWALMNRPRALAMPSWTVSLILVTALSALWSIITPGTEFGHHLLLLVFPFGWVMGLCLQSMRTSIPVRSQVRLSLLLLSLFIVDITLSNHVLLAHIKQFAHRSATMPVASASQPDPTSLQIRNPPVFWFPARVRVTLSPVAQVIRRYTTDSDKMAVWGWNCQYYVETRLAQGVSENHTQRSIIPNRMRDQYLNRYALELRKNKPAVFLDAVGPASQVLNKPDQQHEHFACVDHVIKNDYALVASIDSVRIYIRRDRLTSQRLLPSERLEPAL